MAKKFLALLIVLVMVLSMIPAVSAAESNENTWTPKPTKTYAYDVLMEVGTEEVFLAALTNNKGASHPDYAGKVVCVRLTADITVDDSAGGTRLFIGYYKSKIFKHDIFFQYCMCSNYNINFS